MHEPEKITSFLQAHGGGAYCDDCLATLVGVRRRQNVQRVTSALATTAAYRRESGHCSHCDPHATGREKFVVRAL